MAILPWHWHTRALSAGWTDDAVATIMPDPWSAHLHLIKIGLGPWGTVSEDLKQISQFQPRREPAAVERAVSRSPWSLVGVKVCDGSRRAGGFVESHVEWKRLTQNTCWSGLGSVVPIVPSEALTRWKMNGGSSSCSHESRSDLWC